MFDVAHGAGLAAVWGSWARYVLKDCMPRFSKFARNVMGVAQQDSEEETALKGIEAMEDFYRSIDMPTNMRELGIAPTEEQMKTMAHMCSLAAGGCKGSAKLDRVSDSDSEGRRFEPYRARHFDLEGLFEREVLFFTLNSDLRRFLYGRIQFDW